MSITNLKYVNKYFQLKGNYGQESLPEPEPVESEQSTSQQDLDNIKARYQAKQSQKPTITPNDFLIRHTIPLTEYSEIPNSSEIEGRF